MVNSIGMCEDNVEYVGVTSECKLETICVNGVSMNKVNCSSVNKLQVCVNI